MQKLKTKLISQSIPTYQSLLKNNYLKKKKTKIQTILFENPILLQNFGKNLIEFENSKNLFLPLNASTIFTIAKQYEEETLFNYQLNYDILSNFNKIIFTNILKKRNNVIKGRIIHGHERRALISVLGFIFSIKYFNLNNLINKKILYFKKSNKNKFLKYKKFLYLPKKVKSKKILKSYKLRYLNFKVKKTNHTNLYFSRISYLDFFRKNNKLKNKK